MLFALAGWALALPHYGSEFVVSLALTCLMYVALAIELGLFCGSTRYLSLATVGLLRHRRLHQRAGARAAAVAGAWSRSARSSRRRSRCVMGAAVLHLRGTYFAVLTFGMTELIRHAITYFEKQVTGTVGRVLTVVPERDTVYLTVLALARAGGGGRRSSCARSRFGLALAGIGADEQRAQTLGVNTRCVKIAGFALTAAFAGAVGAAMACAGPTSTRPRCSTPSSASRPC